MYDRQNFPSTSAGCKRLLLFCEDDRKRRRFRKRVVRLKLTDPTMFALLFIRSCLAAIFLPPYHFLRTLLPKRNYTWELPEKEERMPKYYGDDEAWADMEPLPQDDGGLHPLAAIAYTEEYSQAMGYLRAVMAKNEFSERVLALTEHIISMNPAHYTVW
jgi:protein farnesyltransferase/geranylgeranyltransferase type-1 subunit alpha